MDALNHLESYLQATVKRPDVILAIAAIVLHVVNYNLTAQLEHQTRIFTKILEKHAVYYYAVYLVVSAAVRDHYIHEAIYQDAKTLNILPSDTMIPAGISLFVIGVLLNLWTLKALGIKGMYNGDSFGWLMDAPVMDGPYRYLSEPQYVGTTLCLLGTAFYHQSKVGLVLSVVLYIVFMLSVMLLEAPHMKRLYANKPSKKSTTRKMGKKAE